MLSCERLEFCRVVTTMVTIKKRDCLTGLRVQETFVCGSRREIHTLIQLLIG